MLEALQLLLAEMNVVLLLGRKRILVTSRRENRNLHACFNTGLQINVLIQLDVGPVVDKLDYVVGGADSVDAAETLNNAHRIPVNIVIDEIVTILKILAFADAVGGNQKIDFTFNLRARQSFLLRAWRKKRKGRVEVELCFRLQSRARVDLPGHKRSVQTEIRQHEGRNVLVEILSRIRKGREEDHLLVTRVDRVGNLGR